MLTRIRKWRDIDSLVRKCGWDEIVERTLEAADQFHDLISTIPAGAERTRASRTMPLRDIVAHIIDMNFAIGTIIEALGQGKSVTYNMDNFYSGAGKRTWAELLNEHMASRDWIDESTTDPVSSLRKKPHHRYGVLNAREWLGLTIRHYEYHTVQVNRILQSAHFKASVRMAEESRRAVK